MIDHLEDMQAWNDLLKALNRIANAMEQQNNILNNRLRDIYYGTLGER